MKYIPRRTKVKMEFFRGVTLGDLLVALIGIAVLMLILFSNGMTVMTKVYVGSVWVAVIVALLLRISDGMALYTTILLLIKFFAYRKNYSKERKRKTIDIKELIPYVNIRDGFIDYENYYAAVLEVRPIEFWLLNEEKQESVIRTFANALRLVNQEQIASIVKTTLPMPMEEYIYAEDRKYDEVLERVTDKEMSKEEAEARSLIFESRLQRLREFQSGDRIYKDHFYIVLYDNDRESLSITVEGMINTFARGVVPVMSYRLRDTELAVFLKSNYGKEFSQDELSIIPMKEYVKWTMPNIVNFKAGRTVIDGQEYRNFTITDYPLNVANAWAYPFFNLTSTKIVMNLRPIKPDKAEKQLDRAIAELEGRLNGIFKSSKQIEVETQLRTLRELISDLKIGNEYLYNCNIHIMAEEGVKKEVRGVLKQFGFKYSEMFGRQVESFVSQNISRLDKNTQYERGIQLQSRHLSHSFQTVCKTQVDSILVGTTIQFLLISSKETTNV